MNGPVILGLTEREVWLVLQGLEELKRTAHREENKPLADEILKLRNAIRNQK